MERVGSGWDEWISNWTKRVHRFDCVSIKSHFNSVFRACWKWLCCIRFWGKQLNVKNSDKKIWQNAICLWRHVLLVGSTKYSALQLLRHDYWQSNSDIELLLLTCFHDSTSVSISSVKTQLKENIAMLASLQSSGTHVIAWICLGTRGEAKYRVTSVVAICLWSISF